MAAAAAAAEETTILPEIYRRFILIPNNGRGSNPSFRIAPNHCFSYDAEFEKINRGDVLGTILKLTLHEEIYWPPYVHR